MTLAAALPCYTLELGNDLKKIHAVLSDLLAGHAAGRSHCSIPDPDGGYSATRPLVSVIIPVYNGERFIEDSVNNILSQNYPALEIIVVDDGSTDGTRDIISQLPVDIRCFSQENSGPASARNRGIRDASREFILFLVVDDGSTDSSADVAGQFAGPVRYIYQSNKGVSGARNGGIETAQGDFLAFLDSDDLWTKDKLSLQMETLMSGPGLDMVFGHVSHFYSADLEQSIKDRILCPAEKMPGYHPGAMLVRREAFFGIGLFDEKLKAGEFLDWYYKAREKGYKSSLIPEVVMKRRIHASNRGILVRDVRPDYLKVLKAAIDRKRKKNRM